MCWFLDRREGRHYPFWLQAVGDVDRTAIEKTMGAVQAWAVRGGPTKRKPRIWCGLTLAARKLGLLWGRSSGDGQVRGSLGWGGDVYACGVDGLMGVMKGALVQWGSYLVIF